MALRKLGALVAGMALAGASLLVVVAPGASAESAPTDPHALRIVKQIEGVDAGHDFTIEVDCDGWSEPKTVTVGAKQAEKFDVAQASGRDTSCRVVETDGGGATSVGFSCLFVDILDNGRAASDSASASKCTDVDGDSVAVHIHNGSPVEATVTITNHFEPATTTTTAAAPTTTTTPASSTASRPAPPAVLGIARFTG